MSCGGPFPAFAKLPLRSPGTGGLGRLGRLMPPPYLPPPCRGHLNPGGSTCPSKMAMCRQARSAAGHGARNRKTGTESSRDVRLLQVAHRSVMCHPSSDRSARGRGGAGRRDGVCFRVQLHVRARVRDPPHRDWVFLGWSPAPLAPLAPRLPHRLQASQPPVPHMRWSCPL